MNWTIEPLTARHKREEFQCGVPHLDDYIRKYARQHEKRNVGRTFAATAPDARILLGYYTLSASSVSFVHAPPALQKALPRYPIPTALIGKLAVDTSARDLGLGSFLLLDALRRIVEIESHLAIHAVEVHAINDAAKAFYQHYGFEVFLDQANHLYLPMGTVRQLFV